MTLHVGMTGTRNGMTSGQKSVFKRLLAQLGCTHLHQGDCIGADKDAYDIAIGTGKHTICHPPEKSELRAYTVCNETRQEKNYFARNRDIVDESAVLIGTPMTSYETKGGTWYTINYGIKANKPVYVIYPDGNIATHTPA